MVSLHDKGLRLAEEPCSRARYLHTRKNSLSRLGLGAIDVPDDREKENAWQIRVQGARA